MILNVNLLYFKEGLFCARPSFVHRTSTEYWFLVSEFPALVCAFIRSVRTSSMSSVVPCLVLLQY